MLAVVTSLLAGGWLDRAVRSGRSLREEPADPTTTSDEPTGADGPSEVRRTP
jgi:hypothetical protein